VNRVRLARALLAALLAGAGCGRPAPAPPKPRLVVLYAPCTVQRATLAPYDAAVPWTPALAAFARDAQVFLRHTTEVGQSGIAYAALLSGTHAMRHGVYRQPGRLSDAVQTIAEAFHDAGWETYFWAGHPMASPELNYAQGVPPANTYWRHRGPLDPPQDEGLRAEDPRFVGLLDGLRTDHGRRALVVTNFTVSHAPYPAEYADAFCAGYPRECSGMDDGERRRLTALFRDHFLDWIFDFEGTADRYHLGPDERARLERAVSILYRSSIHHLDGLFGAVVAAIDARELRDESVVAFTADHGEILGRDAAGRRWTHGFALSPEDVMVPLLVRAPGVPPGRWGGVSRSIDVFPTLAGLAGVPVGDTVMGADLSAALRGAEDHAALVAFNHTALQPDSWQEPPFASIARGPSRRDPEGMWIAAHDGDLVVKLTGAAGTPLRLHAYDWAADPGEKKDLYDEKDAHQAALAKRIDDYRAALLAGVGEAAGGDMPTSRQQELLRSLGYIH